MSFEKNLDSSVSSKRSSKDEGRDNCSDDFIIQLNVGGIHYSTLKSRLCKFESSLLYTWFHDVTIASTIREGSSEKPILKTPHNWPLILDQNGRAFIDRDGDLFRHILDFLRDGELTLPDQFCERNRLALESKFFQLDAMTEALSDKGKLGQSAFPVVVDPTSYMLTVGQPGLSRNNDDQLVSFVIPPRRSSLQQFERGSKSSTDIKMILLAHMSHITIGYQGTFSFGPQGLASGEVNFRKITRILVSGRVSTCREVFGSTLNESRDPGHSSLIQIQDRYTSRFFLKHHVLEMAFDALSTAGFTLAGCCSSGTSGFTSGTSIGCLSMSSGNIEEDRWAHYNEFVFYRP